MALDVEPTTEEPGANVPPATVPCSRRVKPSFSLPTNVYRPLLALTDWPDTVAAACICFATAAPLKARRMFPVVNSSSVKATVAPFFVPLIELKCSSFSSVRLMVKAGAFPRWS